MEEVKQDVQKYYGQTLKSSADVRTGKSCMLEGSGHPTRRVRDALRSVHADILNSYFGCGLVIPTLIEGMTILDLGSGAGRDCFAISKLIGPRGCIMGVDMTDGLLAIARQNIPYHQEKFGYSQPNVEFRKGFIENLQDAGLQDGLFDIVISNCVLSLSADNPSVLREAYRVLKEGGELFFSDIYAGLEIPQHIRKNKVLWGEGMAGALQWQELVRLASEIGFTTPRLVSAQEAEVDEEELRKVVGDIVYVSATYRLFKVSKDTIQTSNVVTYDGTLLEYEDQLPFDKEHTFLANVPMKVDGQLTSILMASRYKKIFKLEEDRHDDAGVEVATTCPTDPYQYIQRG